MLEIHPRLWTSSAVYVDDKNTLINLRANDSFMDDLPCAVTVPGATFHWSKVYILRQPKSTPEMISKKHKEMRVSTAMCTGKNNSAELKLHTREHGSLHDCVSCLHLRNRS